MRLLAAAILLLTTLLRAQAPADQAEMFYKHRLPDDAKRTAINALFAATSDEQMVRCKALLARIAMDEGRLDSAVELWQDLSTNHPDSTQGKVASEMLKQWSSLARSASDTVLESAIARSYASAADFWTGGGHAAFSIDTSWLPTEEAAEFWLRKITTEFPNTPASEAALVSIARTWLGREGTGRYGFGGSGAWGAASQIRESSNKSRAEFDRMMARAISTIREIEKTAPNCAHLPRLQYMVAHIYWFLDDRQQATPWLEQIKKSATDAPTFWSHLASLRLQHWRS